MARKVTVLEWSLDSDHSENPVQELSIEELAGWVPWQEIFKNLKSLSLILHGFGFGFD